jgi:hypothetical protein
MTGPERVRSMNEFGTAEKGNTVNIMEETPGIYRVEFVGLSIRQIKDILEDHKWGSLVWSGGKAYPAEDVMIRFIEWKRADKMQAALEMMKERLRVDDPHGMYDVVCDALLPNTPISGGTSAA